MSAQRDWSMKEYKAAAERNNFAVEMMGLWLRDTTIQSGTMYGCVTEGGAICYRASLASAIKQRAAEIALGQRVIKLAAEGKSETEIMEVASLTKTQLYLARRAATERTRLEKQNLAG